MTKADLRRKLALPFAAWGSFLVGFALAVQYGLDDGARILRDTRKCLEDAKAKKLTDLQIGAIK